ncbi:benzoate 1,2-dioxygenase large subunit [Pigmentiphaga daeguensis]|uniref:Benzoate 1,2-dioxygenase large subunit n=2 Tax=Pigmentiphaga daeguensis TaxID=414049 RepID=A0ABN1CFJ6_9BURK
MGNTMTPATGALVDDRLDQGIFRVNRRAFTDPDTFEREMREIFERRWVYLCHESQLPEPGSYATTYVGRQPVVVIRQRDGSVKAFLNACPHRASILLPLAQGKAKSAVTCRFHGWVFGLDGACQKIKSEERGNYPADHDREHYGLKSLARVDDYRGWIFGSLAENVPALTDHLGAATTFMDMLADQSPHGLELLRGKSTYVVRHNWKIEAENVNDGYHVPTVHRVFNTTIVQREARGGYDGLLGTETGRIRGVVKTGGYDLGNGHMLTWADRASPHVAPIYPETQALEQRFPGTKSHWILRRGRNLMIFPNLVLNDLASTHLRTLRPLGHDRTEINLWCIAPRGETSEARAARLRKFEDFFLVTGMATSDDVVSLDAAQEGANGLAQEWHDYVRGLASSMNGPDDEALALGIEPIASETSWDHDTPFYGFYRHWLSAIGGAAQ